MKKKTMLCYIRGVAFLAILFVSSFVLANHPVLVEGESDFDGDGLLGTDEDLDGDRIFGTISTALAADLGAVNNNGRVTIVTSGRFPESILINAANGNVALEAAPGVDASIDAVLAGAPGNVERQNAPGIVIDAPGNRSITIRNLSIRNWRDGLVIRGQSRVVIEDCRIDQNLNHGILSQGNASVLVRDSSITGTGFRVGAAGNAPAVDAPAPGTGVRFEGNSRGAVINTAIVGNFDGGLINDTSGPIDALGLVLFDNADNRDGWIRKLKDAF